MEMHLSITNSWICSLKEQMPIVKSLEFTYFTPHPIATSKHFTREIVLTLTKKTISFLIGMVKSLLGISQFLLRLPLLQTQMHTGLAISPQGLLSNIMRDKQILFYNPVSNWMPSWVLKRNLKYMCSRMPWAFHNIMTQSQELQSNLLIWTTTGDSGNNKNYCQSNNC